MICPLDKWVALCALLKEVVGKPILSLKTVHRLAGVMIWLSSGFSMGTAAVISVVAVRTAGVATQAKEEVCPFGAHFRCEMHYYCGGSRCYFLLA